MENRYLTFALGKGRLAKKTLELFEEIGITCEEMKEKDTRKLIFVNEELKLRFFLAKGPDVPTYVSYNAPFWKLRVGDFRSHEEAYHMMRQLMAAFPKYGKEMYIVREEIKIPLNEE